MLEASVISLHMKNQYAQVLQQCLLGKSLPYSK